MKNTKNIVCALSIAVSFGSQCSQNEPVIEIRNKSKQRIRVRVYNNTGKLKASENSIDGNKDGLIRWQVPSNIININDNIKIEITEQPTDLHKSKIFTIDAPGKTKYLSWDSNRTPSLYPQSGPLAGLSTMIGMKTTSNLSLKNNISAGQIKQTDEPIK